MPKSKMKMDEWLGRLVRLTKRLETRGGTVFEEGEILRVDRHHRGRLGLLDPAEDGKGLMTFQRRFILKVDRKYVELLPLEEPARG